MTTLAASAAVPIRLGDVAVRVALTQSSSQTGVSQAISAGHRVELVLSGLRAAQQPGITYRVYLGVAEGAVPDDAHLVSTINFYSFVLLDGAKPGPDQPRRFDVTDLVRKVMFSGLFKGGLFVTLVPDGEVENNAQPEIGNIAIIEK